jgi:hypothetical protein
MVWLLRRLSHPGKGFAGLTNGRVSFLPIQEKHLNKLFSRTKDLGHICRRIPVA